MENSIKWIWVSQFPAPATHMDFNAHCHLAKEYTSVQSCPAAASVFIVFFKPLFLERRIIKGAARVRSRGALNNCRQVQSGNGSSEIRPRKKKLSREASVGALFVLVSAWVSICARGEYTDPLLKDVQRKTQLNFTATAKQIWAASLGFP